MRQGTAPEESAGWGSGYAFSVRGRSARLTAAERSTVPREDAARSRGLQAGADFGLRRKSHSGKPQAGRKQRRARIVLDCFYHRRRRRRRRSTTPRTAPRTELRLGSR